MLSYFWFFLLNIFCWKIWKKTQHISRSSWILKQFEVVSNTNNYYIVYSCFLQFLRNTAVCIERNVFHVKLLSFVRIRLLRLLLKYTRISSNATGVWDMFYSKSQWCDVTLNKEENRPLRQWNMTLRFTAQHHHIYSPLWYSPDVKNVKWWNLGVLEWK